MVYSYLGLAKPMAVVNESIKSHLLQYRSNFRGVVSPLEPGGVLASNFEKTVKFAANHDMSVYYSAEDLLEKSDIIFVFLADKAIRSLASSLRNRGIRNKIICHFSPAFNSDILDFDSANTYVSFVIPSYDYDETNKPSASRFFAEGYGDMFDEFRYVLKIIGIDVTVLTTQEKALYLTASQFLVDFPKFIEEAAERLLRISLWSSPSAVQEIMQQYKNRTHILNSYSGAAHGNIEFAYNQKNALDSLGIKDISNLFAALMYAEANRLAPDNPASADIAKLAAKMIKLSNNRR